MADTRIEDAPQIAQFATPLKELGYRSLEQFLGTAAVEPDALAKYLKIDVNRLQTIVASVPRPAGRRVGIGARLDAPARKDPK
jgi:hypothetical protein